MRQLIIHSFPAVLGFALLVSAACPASPLVPSRDTDEALIKIKGDQLPPTIQADNSELKVVSARGGMVVEALLKSSVPVSKVDFKPATPWDFSGKGAVSLAFDIANVGEHSTQLYLTIKDKRGAFQDLSVVIPAGGEVATYYMVLSGEETKIDSGLRSDPPASDPGGHKFVWMRGWNKIDLSAVAAVSLHINTNLHDRRLQIGNVRLFRNPKIDPDFLTGIVDKFGQNRKADFPYKVSSDADLKSRVTKELSALAGSGPMKDRSKFGGWKDGPRLKGTGFFRTEKVGGKWALVDPEGYLYFASGLANARMANTTTITGVDFREPTVRVIDPEDVTPEDSMPFIQTSAEARASRYIASELRHKMFTWLPGYDDPLADHYHYKRETHKGPVKHGESFSFYQANLERRYGQTSPGSYLDKWRDVTVDRMEDWGFTCLGNWADEMFFQIDRIPYFANGWIIGEFKTVTSGNDVWRALPDPFDPEFVRRAKVTVKAVADQVQGNPWCVGVFIDNEMSWGRMGTFESQYGVVINTLTRDAAESPTKAAWVALLKDQYGEIRGLNTAWQTTFDSWDAFAKSAGTKARSEAVKKDYSTLLKAYAHEYFKVVSGALEEVLPNHLYMGCRMTHWGMTTEVIDAAKTYADVVSYNFYKEGLLDRDWPFLEEVDRPSIIGEFHMGAISDTGLYHHGLIMAADQKDRGRKFQDYMHSVIDNPYFVGAHWFQYIDSPLTGRAHDGENYNVGFVTITDIPYPEMVDAAKELHRGLYERKYGDLKKK